MVISSSFQRAEFASDAKGKCQATKLDEMQTANAAI
jgi:hypothetical protein